MSIKSFLVVALLALSVLLGLVLGRGGSDASPRNSPQGEDRVIIGLSLDTLKEARWAQDRDAFVSRAQSWAPRSRCCRPTVMTIGKLPMSRRLSQAAST